MNIKRISIFITVLVMVLLTACEGIQPTEIILSEEPQVYDEETPPVVDEVEDQEEPSLVADIEPPLESQTVITRQNAHELTQIQSYGKAGVNDFAWSPDGNTLARASAQGITLFDKHTHEITLLSIYGNQPQIGHIITFSPNGDMLAVSYTKGVVEIYDIESQELLFTLDEFEDMMAFGIAFSSDNTRLATGWGNPWGFGSGSVKIWDMSTGTMVSELGRDYDETIYNLAYSHDGNLLAAISGFGQVHIWNLTEETEEMTLTGTSGYGFAVSFSPDGNLLAAGGAASNGMNYDYEPAELHLFDTRSGDLLFDLEGHQSIIRSLAFNPDGDLLASASDDDTVRLWDTQTGEQLALLDIPGANSAAFSPDGTLLATAGFWDVLRLWGTPETATNIEDSSPDTALENLEIDTGTIQALAHGEDFRPGRWSPDGRFVYFTDQGPMDEPGPDQAYQTLTFLDAQNSETCASLQEIVNFSYNAWAEEKIPVGPTFCERAFWMNDNRLLYLSPDGELFAITPCSDSVEDWTDALPESITAFYYGENFDRSQLLLKGESGAWIFAPSTRQSVKVAVPESSTDEGIDFAWSPWEAKLISSRVESGEGGLKIVIENIDPVTGVGGLIAEFPVVNEGGGWGHSVSPFISWTAKNQIFLHYLDNYHENEKLIDLSSRPVKITHVFTDLFGIEPPSLDSGLSLFGESNTTGEEDYYLSVGTGLSPDGQLYLYSAKTGEVDTYPLDPPKLLTFPNGDMLIAESYGEKSDDVPLQIIQIGTEKAPYDLVVIGQIPGQNKSGKILMTDDKQHLLVTSDQGISLVDPENGETTRFWNLENQAQYDDLMLSPSPDGKTVMVYAIQIYENEDWWNGHTRAIYLLNLDS